MVRGIPQYLRVYNSLKGQIEIGDYKVGDFLLPEPELQKVFRVSRTTVRKSVEMLAQQGFVYIRQGKGTVILDFKATQKLGFVTSFSETLREKGFTVTQAGITIEFVPAPRRIASELKIQAGDRLVKIDRVTMANNAPIALMTNYLLPDLAPGIEKKIAGMSSLYSFLESEYGLVIEAATDYITARQAVAEEALALQVPESSPLLVVRRITYSGGRPIELAILRVIADRYEYCVHTKERPARVSVLVQATAAVSGSPSP